MAGWPPMVRNGGFARETTAPLPVARPGVRVTPAETR